MLHLVKRRKALDEEIAAIKEELELRGAVAEEDGDDHEQVITDHAVLGYMERVQGVNVAAVRREMISSRAVGLVRSMSFGHIAIRRGKGRFKMRIKDGKVITVIE